MWLPVLLWHDLGPWSFAIFAIPNCIGAALLGFVVPSREASMRFTDRHSFACRAFSTVTYLFQCFFLAAMASYGAISPLRVAIALGAFLIPTVLSPLLSGRVHGHRLLGALIYAASLGLAAWLLLSHQALPNHRDPQATGWQLSGLASACIFGFIFCPYLDLTFHRARQNLRTPEESHLAFAAGFCGFFLSMILLTFAYARLLWDSPALGPWLVPTAIFIHISIQIAFKLVVHQDEVHHSLPAARRGSTSLLPIAGAAIISLTVLLRLAMPTLAHETFEFLYRSFMGFYGLVAPAYVWLCVLPMQRPEAPLRPTRGMILVLAIAIVAALPFYWLGFLAGRYEWTLAGVALVVFARIFVRPVPPQPLTFPVGSASPNT
jgi:hypothetical protein